MTTVCPTVTTITAQEYREQMEKLASFAVRVHIDLSDGLFSPVKLIDINDVWWPGGMHADIHLMYKQPSQHLLSLVALSPQLVIIHAEADGDFEQFANTLHHHGIEVGVALLAETPVSLIASALPMIDHVLIFSGNLGHYGGRADLGLLGKVKELRSIKPQLEISWDGGINDQNATSLIQGGIDVLNVGGYIAKANDPSEAYDTLKALAKK